MLTMVMVVVAAGANADALFDEGRALLKAGQLNAACERFEQSHTVEPALGTLLNLADCDERRGQLVKAYLEFNDALAWAGRTHEAAREQAARQRASALKSKLAWLSVTMPSPPPELEVRVGTFAVKLGAGAQALPVDAGEVEVHANAPGHLPTTTKATAVAGKTVMLALEPLKAKPSDAPVRQEVAKLTEPAPTPAPPPAVVVQRAPGGVSSAAVGTAIAGGTLVLVGAVGLGYSYATYGRMERQQPGGVDAANPTLTRGEFETLGWLYPASWAVVGVGAAALVGGTVWAIGSRNSVHAQVVPTAGGAMVVGGW